MEQESSSLYTQTMGNQPLTVLLLIENSQKMLSVWQELKEHYLNPLVETIVQSSGSVQTSFFVIESSVDTNIASYSPRQYPASQSALMSVNFGYGLDGRISPARVEHCIQHLDGSSYNVDLSSSLHLVIVAASAPTNDCSGIAVPAAVSPWNVLADRLTERNIHCHLVMAPGQEDVSPFTILFEHTLVQQNYVEEVPPFPVDRSRYILRLSARPSYQTLAENGTLNLPAINEQMLTPLTITRAPLRMRHPADLGTAPYASSNGINMLGTTSRRNSYPPDTHDGVIASSSNSTLASSKEISLVSQLKLAQGLIKKKQHAKEPHPAPFIADTRVQEPTSSTYSLISSPSSSIVSPTIPSTVPTLANTSPSAAATPISLSSVPLTSRYRKPQPLSTGFPSNGHQDTIPSPTNGGRAISLSRLDRMQRINHAASGSSPTEPIHAQTHGRRGSQLVASGHTPPGHGGWYNGSHSATHAQVQQAQAQRRGSRLSTPELDISMGSPASSASSVSSGSGSGSGSVGGTVVGMPNSAMSGSTMPLGMSMGTGSPPIPGNGPGSVASAASMSTPSLGTPGSVAGAVGYYDTSPGSGSSYVSSDMSSPATPGSMDDLYAHAHMQAAQHQQQQQEAAVARAYEQESAWQNHSQQQRLQMQHQHQQHVLQFQQSQEMQYLHHQQQQEHHYGLQHTHQTQVIQQQPHGLTPPAQPVNPHHPGGYDPAAQDYFPPQRPPSAESYYAGETQQSAQQHSVVQHPASEGQMQNVPVVQHAQAMPHPQVVPQPYNPYPALAVPTSDSPPPMVVPSQLHASNGTTASGILSNTPTTAINVIDAHVVPNGPTAAHGIPMVPPPQQNYPRSRQAAVAHGGISKSSTSPVRPIKGRKHRKAGSMSSSAHPHPSSANSNATVESTNSSSNNSSHPPASEEKMFHVSPLYAATTGVLFEATFNIKSGLLDGPSALANAEDIALVAPALGMAAPDNDGNEVLARLSLGTVEAGGGLFQNSLRDRGAVVDQAAGTAVVPAPAVAAAAAAAAAPRGMIATGPAALVASQSSSLMPPPPVPASATGMASSAYSMIPPPTTHYTYATHGDYGSSLSWSN